MARNTALRWICTRCKKKIEGKGKPDKCDRCKTYGSFIFYEAKLIKGAKRSG